MQEIEVFVHHQAGTYRIHQLYYAGQEEYKSGDKATETLHSQEKISHNADVYAFIL